MSTADNINGIYAKDTELRNGISELRGDILSQTIKPLNITENGTYTSDPTVGAYGYSPIIVDVQEEPWRPLQDGYSNFWFELTNDTLSPWLNFSAKNNNATIDWGDGSGEQALTTLTPTHTYSKAGKYVVKVKGVTGIGRQLNPPYNSGYLVVLNYVELNSEVISLVGGAFLYCTALKYVIENSISSIGSNATFQSANQLRETLAHNGTQIPNYGYSYCSSLDKVTLDGVVTIGQLAFYTCVSIKNVTIPNTVTSIGNSCFSQCSSLNEIHIQSTNPAIFGTNVFQNVDANFIIYVPVGTGETYKAASGWSTYADHILEEGQTPNRMMLAKFNSNNTDNEEMR